MRVSAVRAVSAGLVLFAAGLVAGGMLSAYGDGPSFPLGADTAHHVWRMRLVTAEGLDGLPTFVGSHLLNANPDRPGLPITAAAVSSVGGPGGLELAFVLPAVAAAVIVLAAAATARRALAEHDLAVPLVALAAGASVPVAFAANGPLEQLLATTLLVAAVATLVPAANGDRSAAGATVVLLAGAWTYHWMVAGVVVATFLAGAIALMLIPGGSAEAAGERRRAGMRIAFVVLLAVIACAAIAWLLPGPLQGPLGITGDQVSVNVSRQLPEYLRPPLLLLAAGGVIALWLRRGRTMPALAVLAGWTLMPVAGVLLALRSDELPLHRFFSTALSIPILAAVGAVGCARVIRGRKGGPLRSVVGGLTAAALVLVLTFQAWGVWQSRGPSTPESVVAKLAAVGRALRGTDRPVVLVVEDLPDPDGHVNASFGTIPALRRLRAVVPENLISRTVVYLGDPDRALAGEPTLRPGDDRFNEVSLDAWRAVAPLVSQDPTILVLRPYAATFDRIARVHPEWVAAPWLLSSSPGLAGIERTPAIEPPPGSSLGQWAAQVLALLVLVGVGWSVALGGADTSASVALAPAMGLALLAIGGLVADSAGGDVGGPGGRIVTLAVGVTGAVAAVAVRLRVRRAGPRVDAPLSAARSG